MTVDNADDGFTGVSNTRVVLAYPKTNVTQ